MNRLDHAHLFSSDIEKTVEFFTTMFGGTVVYDTELVGQRNVRVDIGGGAVHVYEQPPRGAGRPLIHHLGIRTDDLDALVAHMRAQGVAFPRGIREAPAFRYTMCEAPDGLLLELYQVKPGGEWMVGAGEPPPQDPTAAL